MAYTLLADTLLVIHALIVVFVILGLILIIIGIVRRWDWVSNFWFRGLHLFVIGVVTLMAWLGRLCPLTIWENSLRVAAGDEGYSSTFIQYWLHKLIYYTVPIWVFAIIYSLFLGVVVLTWVIRPPQWSRLWRRRE